MLINKGTPLSRMDQSITAVNFFSVDRLKDLLHWRGVDIKSLPRA